MVEACGDLILASSKMAESRLDTTLVVPVAILSSTGLPGEQATSCFFLLVQLDKDRLRQDGDFSRGQGQVGTLICSHDWSGWNSGQSGEIVPDIHAVTIVVGSRK